MYHQQFTVLSLMTKSVIRSWRWRDTSRLVLELFAELQEGPALQVHELVLSVRRALAGVQGLVASEGRVELALELGRRHIAVVLQNPSWRELWRRRFCNKAVVLAPWSPSAPSNWPSASRHREASPCQACRAGWTPEDGAAASWWACGRRPTSLPLFRACVAELTQNQNVVAAVEDGSGLVPHEILLSRLGGPQESGYLRLRLLRLLRLRLAHLPLQVQVNGRGD